MGRNITELILYSFFQFTVYIQYDFVPVSGVQLNGQTIKCSTKCFLGTKVTKISLTLSPVLYCTSCVYYVTTHLYFLVTSSFSPILYSSKWYTISICPVTDGVNLDKGGFFKFLHSKVTFSFVINKSLLLR